MDLRALISKVRNGEEMSDEEIEWFIAGVATGEHSIEAISEWLRAVFDNGMSTKEKVTLTKAMMNSGEILSWGKRQGEAGLEQMGVVEPNLVVDKHSTGGVGDKMSLMLAPALAACGLKVPMLAGRGLGHTGGTIDKLESIPNFNTSLTPQKMVEQVEWLGCCIAAQNKAIAPADGLLYAIRDVTGTVASVPLITASIISKKAAEGLACLVLDVKCGRAAFMKTEKEATELARSMVDVATGLGIHTIAQITHMDTPIGRMIGNSLEVIECIEVLNGSGPTDTTSLVTLQGGYLLHMAGKAETPQQGEAMITKTLEDGTALDYFRRMCINQGVNNSVAEELTKNPRSVLPKCDTTTLYAEEDGYVKNIDGMALAKVARKLGAGREELHDLIDHSVGLELHTEVGARLTQGRAWLTVHHRGELSLIHSHRLKKALSVSRVPTQVRGRLISIIE